MDEAEDDALPLMACPREHRAKICSKNALRCINGEIKRRTDVVGMFQNEAVITGLVGVILLAHYDESAAGRRYMTPEHLASINDAPNVSLPAVAA